MRDFLQVRFMPTALLFIISIGLKNAIESTSKLKSAL